MTVRCSASAGIDFDSVTCDLEVGHRGFHSMQGDGPRILWVEKHTGSTGYVSPRETWPDDTDCNEAIAEAPTVQEAFWEIAEKYDVPVTGNMPRWQEGQFLRQAGDFIGDCMAVMGRFQGSQPTDPGTSL